MMRTTIHTPPVAEPVSLDEAKQHAKVEIDDDDVLIAGYIETARLLVEMHTSLAMVSRTLDGYLDRFPRACDRDGTAMVLPHPPLVSVELVEYTPSDNGAAVPLTVNVDYAIDAVNEPGRVVPMPGKSWPATGQLPNPVHLRYVAGYGGAEDVPAGMRQAVLVLVADMYDNRSPVPTSFALQQMRHLLAPYVLGRIW